MRVIAGLLLAVALSAPAAAQSLQKKIERVREQVYPALVNISMVVRTYGGGRQQRFPGAGSGVIVTAEGHVLTNYHVAGNTTQIRCTLTNGEILPGEVLWHDPLTDLSVLKLDLSARQKSTEALSFAPLGDSSKLNVGDYVLAMGNPMGLSSSLTLGVISNTSRVFTDRSGSALEERTLDDGEATGLLTRWLQHDALILPGNSGGPLVNLEGEVIGINELGGSGVAFAIPSDLAKDVLHQVLAKGRVDRGWVGCQVLPVLKLGKRTGALISHVDEGSPAEAAGLRAGDIVTGFETPEGTEEVRVLFFEDVPRFHQSVATLDPESNVTFHVERGENKIELELTVASMEAAVGSQKEFRGLGMTVREITGPMARARRLPSRDGVLVTGVRPGEPAAEAEPGLARRDVILEIDGKKVSSLDEVAAALKAVADSEEYAVRVRRGREEIIAVVDNREKQKERRPRELPKGWLGVETQVVTAPLARRLQMPGAKGFRVTDVLPGTEAEKAGLEVGDVIRAVAGEPMEASQDQDARILERHFEELEVGGKVELTVLRAGQELKLPVVTERAPKKASAARTAEQDDLEFSVREITLKDRLRLHLPEDQRGVIVTKVTPGGWGQLAGLRGGDLLMRVDEEEVSGLKAFKKLMKSIVESQPTLISFFIRRGYRTHFVFMEPDWDTTGTTTPPVDKQ